VQLAKPQGIIALIITQYVPRTFNYAQRREQLKIIVIVAVASSLLA
jgi:hypothetical protein